MSNPPISAEQLAELEEASRRATPEEPEREFHPVADIFPMMSNQEFADLKADIAEHGMREPVWLHEDGRIIDGRNRYLACRQAGLPYDYRTYDGEDSEIAAFIVSLNLHRRHLSESQRAMVASRIANMRQGERTDIVEISTMSQADAAKELNVSRESVVNAKKVSESPVAELGEKVDSGDIAVSTAASIADAPEEEQREVIAADDEKAIIKAAKDIKRRKMEEARERKPEPVAEPVALPDGVHRCIVIDPPWPVEKIEREERPDQGSTLDYSTMPINCQRPITPGDNMLDLQPCFVDPDYCPDHDNCTGDNHDYVPCQSIQCTVGSVLGQAAHDDCHIYLWVTQKYLPDGLQLLESWGFSYQCVMTWRKNVGITPYSWMYDTEHVLFGRKGNLKLERLGLRLSFDAPTQGHSIKPDVFYDRVREASPGPRLDMFPGVEHDGFTPWGLEATHRAVV